MQSPGMQVRESLLIVAFVAFQYQSALTFIWNKFKKEVYSDLTGERGTLDGAIQGIFLRTV